MLNEILDQLCLFFTQLYWRGYWLHQRCEVTTDVTLQAVRYAVKKLGQARNLFEVIDVLIIAPKFILRFTNKKLAHYSKFFG